MVTPDHQVDRLEAYHLIKPENDWLLRKLLKCGHARALMGGYSHILFYMMSGEVKEGECDTAGLILRHMPDVDITNKEGRTLTAFVDRLIADVGRLLAPATIAQLQRFRQCIDARRAELAAAK